MEKVGWLRMLLENVILKPLITEKATNMADTQNCYTFLGSFEIK